MHARSHATPFVCSILLLASIMLVPVALRAADAPGPKPLPRVGLSRDGRAFETAPGRAFVPFGVNYFRPGTGWAPQLWKRFDAEATRQDFARMKALGLNCVRVFLTFGSFCPEPGVLDTNGLSKFDQFLALAEQAGIYVHPTGPDHWEGLPAWARTDRLADETVLRGLESFWQQLAARYRGRGVVFAYDLLNEPSVGWDTAPLRAKWNVWLEKKYGAAEKLAEAWGAPNRPIQLGTRPVPPAREAPGSRELLDYQTFREEIADEWTRCQVRAIKSADPDALVTVGFIQWSVPALLPGVQHYAAFRPERQARFLDFLEVHFYPLERGFYEYRTDEDETRNLAYLESVVREVARSGKAVVLAEFGWYGGGQLTIDNGRHPAATEEQQARWGRRAVETTRPFATGWLNWGLYDHPEARDVTQLIGLLKVDGQTKVWGREFQRLSGITLQPRPLANAMGERPALDWDACVTSLQAGQAFREKYLQAFQVQR
jgi:hypothetical protein